MAMSDPEPEQRLVLIEKKEKRKGLTLRKKQKLQFFGPECAGQPPAESRHTRSWPAANLAETAMFCSIIPTSPATERSRKKCHPVAWMQSDGCYIG